MIDIADIDRDRLDAWRRVQRAISAQAEAEGLTPEDVDRAVERARTEMYAERAADSTR